MAGMSFDALNSKLEHTTASDFNVTQLTLLAHVRPNSAGENGRGRIFGASEAGGATEGFAWFNRNAVQEISFLYVWSNLAQWSTPYTHGVWSACAVTYDRTSVSNVPTMRVNYAAASVTTVLAPTGAVAQFPASGYAIGNTSAQDRTWDGGIMHLQFHPTQLSTANQDKALRYPGSVRTTGAIWWPLLHGTYTRALTWNGSAWVNSSSQPTATSLATFTTNSPGPRRRRLVSIPATMRRTGGLVRVP